MGHHPEMPNREALLLKQQRGKCNHCGLNFREDDLLEVDHNLDGAKSEIDVE